MTQTIKDVGKLFRLKKELDGSTVRDIKNLFRLKKENEAIENRIICFSITKNLGTLIAWKSAITRHYLLTISGSKIKEI